MHLIDLTVAHAIPAKPEEIFDLWLDADSPGGPWFGVERVLLQPVVDGLFYMAVKNEGRSWPHYGRFLRIERPRRIEYTWLSEATGGHETLVTVTFEPHGEQTTVTLHHAGVPDDERGRQHREGWSWMLSMLAQRFAARPPGSDARP